MTTLLALTGIPPFGEMELIVGRDVHTKLTDDVERHGFSVLWVFDEEGEEPDFAYSVGLWGSCHHPEFVVVGLPQEISVRVISEIARMVVSGQRFGEGDRVRDVLEGFEVLIGHVGRNSVQANMVQSVWFSGDTNLDALQVLWPDRWGTFPNRVGFDSRLIGRQDLR